MSKNEYVRIMVKASILPLILLDEGLGCVFLFSFVFSCYHWYPTAWNASDKILQCIILLLVLCVFCFAARKVRAHVASAISSVMPITRHNTGNLPAVATLARLSDLPPSHQQAELLRAAPQSGETPAEELLRATIGSEQKAL